MSQFITLSTLNNNAAKHTLEQINDCESSIASYEIELNTAQEDDWRTKETACLLTDQKDKKLSLIKHLNECFNVEYNVELHQSLAYYKQLLSVINNCQNIEWCNAMWLGEIGAAILAKETKTLAEKTKEEITKKHNITSEQLDAAAL